MSSKAIEFLTSRVFFRNIIILLVISVSGFFILNTILKNYTHHGENISVPDLRGVAVSKLDSVLTAHTFNFKIVDSLYDFEKNPGTVLDQDPAPKSKVKENRTIYLTINATQPPDVKMPDLIDVSYRQAEAILQSFGLVTGDVIYRSDLAKNAVLEQLYKNRTIKPGAMIPKGATIDLVLGDGLGDIEIQVPDLTGLTLEEAQTRLKGTSLTVGIVEYDDNVQEKSEAVVYKQSPTADSNISLKQGDGVDLFLH